MDQPDFFFFWQKSASPTSFSSAVENWTPVSREHRCLFSYCFSFFFFLQGRLQPIACLYLTLCSPASTSLTPSNFLSLTVPHCVCVQPVLKLRLRRIKTPESLLNSAVKPQTANLCHHLLLHFRELLDWAWTSHWVMTSGAELGKLSCLRLMQSETLKLGDNIVGFLTAVQIGQGRLEVKGNSNSDLDTFTSYSAACCVYTLEHRLCHSGWSILFLTGGLNGYATLDFAQPDGLFMFSAVQSRHPTAHQSGDAFVLRNFKTIAPGIMEERVSEDTLDTGRVYWEAAYGPLKPVIMRSSAGRNINLNVFIA